jgi:predicted extracellular nuclease
MVRPHRRTVPALIAALLLSLLTILPASADNAAQELPFSQDWSNTSLIVVSDDWSGVPGVIGFLGQDITTATGTDPQTLLGESTFANDVDVIASRTTLVTNGGVGEFEFANPVVALQGSGTADAPYLLFHVNTTGVTNVLVSYNLRDIDDAADDAVQPVALHYRAGSTGPFTNVPAAFVPDATTGPSLATLVTPVSVTLPADASNQPLVQIRVMTTNAANPSGGGDEWVGVDDIEVTGDPIADPTPTPTPDTSPTPTPTPTPEPSPTPSPTPTPTPTPDPCTSAFTPIYSIQGSGLAAAIQGNVTTQGVVVGDFEGSTATGLQGFYLQDATGDADAATSDGLFVFTGNANVVSAGQIVRVTGFARERFNQTTLNGSNSNTAAVTAANIVTCGTGSITPTDVTLPFDSVEAPEQFEGMSVRLPQDLVISEYFNYARFGEMVLALPLDGETRPFTPTLVAEPGAPAQARADQNLLSRITLDDGLGAQNPPSVRHPNGAPFSLANRFRGGDLVTNTVGVLGFDFSLYRIQPTASAEYTPVNPRPAEPEDVGGRLKVAAMNTLNFFLTLDPLDDPTTPDDDNPADNICGPTGAEHDCRGADLSQPLEFDRQRDKLIAALSQLDADVIGLNELENTLNVDPLGDPDGGLVAGLNEELGAGTYAAIDTGVIGTDAIRVGLIYRPEAVTPMGDFAILDSSVDPRFDTTLNRPALAQTFEENATGARFTVVVNHLKSKGSDCVDVGDPDTGDGQGNCNLTRKAAAQALVDWIETDPTRSGDRDVLVIGDLNSYAKEDPIDAVLLGPDDLPATQDDFSNLVSKYEGPFAYSFVFDGQAGYLDHALSSATLTPQVTGATEWHINADEPSLLDYDTSFKPAGQEAVYAPDAYRASDHDPVIVGLNLVAPYRFEGYRPPVNPDNTATINAGSALPMKFTLNDATGLDVLFANPRSRQVSCATGAPLGDWEATAVTVGLTEFPAGTYTYDWKTDKAWADTCRVFELTLDDGSYWTANVHFIK